jgi:four helix bundle protein
LREEEKTVGVAANGSAKGPSYRDLIAWQRAVDLVEVVYRVTQGWPKEKQYGLTNQVRRAAVSVPANIAEGQGRTGKAFGQHLSIAYGSLCEVETHMIVARRLGFIDAEVVDQTLTQTTAVARPLRGLMRSLE